MSYRKIIKALLFIGSILLFTVCTPNQVSTHKGGYYYSGIYFVTNFPSNYKKGIRDGCTTSKGTYIKS